MTLREAAEHMDIEKGIYNIGFNGCDETQYDAEGLTDLEDLWKGFCREEGCALESVDYVEYAGGWCE